VDGPHIVLPARSRTPMGVPRVLQGSKPADGARLKIDGKYITRSNLILGADDREAFLARAPEARDWLRPYVG